MYQNDFRKVKFDLQVKMFNVNSTISASGLGLGLQINLWIYGFYKVWPLVTCLAKLVIGACVQFLSLKLEGSFYKYAHSMHVHQMPTKKCRGLWTMYWKRPLNFISGNMMLGPIQSYWWLLIHKVLQLAMHFYLHFLVLHQCYHLFTQSCNLRFTW